MSESRASQRRRFLHRAGAIALGAGLSSLAPRAALAALGPDARSLSFEHTHTGEHISLVYAMGDQVLPQAQQSLNHFLRDHYSGTVGEIDPKLFGLLFALRREVGGDAPFQVISGYRCPITNERLRKTRGGGVAKHSLHMDGMAIDIRLPGVALGDLRDAAQSLQVGGAGFYKSENFVHVDTGRVRRWG
ncbi:MULTISPECIES: DUF882 domain-containing protein [unclassified Cupriavidus]|uniref:YcbK family protein n=1 Tax=unclassified Cupriavidus TaxID=2640874 RepID=UPI001C00250D|nr:MULTISPECIES: DUF882 domain-containing protein [unclassified Cupriavidus]MCA3183727.1 DUF882 domain-containing protein [Cupriavidus sp.]MCA3191916.1 DUF882 domain-containing protein [Cupriavidus sp.]MCA3197661.1 DUF882 domain-containing protein [Cupriavidus sp.]MCA3202713.1 DUF882 domain-containing protein [Cupriavidus sp.]MCA3209079.1 DUF882 domain-containing protein [Cupriavidus sp.]